MTPGRAMKIRHRLKVVSKGPLPTVAAIAAAGLAVAFMFPLPSVATVGPPAGVEVKYSGDTLASEADLTTCTEDMPCWDCKTMGNKVCGIVASSYAEAYGWCAGFYHDEPTVKVECQWAASRSFTDATNPLAGRTDA